jgi:hypothetical protein
MKMTRMFFVDHYILNKFGHVHNFRRTNSFQDNVVRKFIRATRIPTNQSKRRNAVERLLIN